MGTEFPCKHCGSTIKIQYLYPGEIAVCRNCGKENVVPGNPEEINPEKEHFKPSPGAWKPLEIKHAGKESHKRALSQEEKQAVFDEWMPRAHGLIAFNCSMMYIVTRTGVSSVPSIFKDIFLSQAFLYLIVAFGAILSVGCVIIIYYYVAFTCGGFWSLIDFTWHFPYHKRKHKKPFLYVLFVAIAFEILIWVCRLFDWII